MDTNILRLIEAGLSQRVGRKQAITNKQIRDALEKRGVKVSGAEVREAVHELRTKYKMFIIGDNSGYYLAETTYEREQWLKTMNSRIREMLEVLNTMRLEHAKRAQQTTLNL